MSKIFLQENQFIIPSYQHYGGFSGFQDYGILGLQIKNKLLNLWRDFFLGTDVHEVEIPSIMPHAVLKASGHVDRFTDYIVYDNEKICHRADHLAKKWFNDNNMTELINLVDSWDQETLELNINKYLMLGFEVKVQKKNLMIEVPSNTLVPGADTDFMRPELAQGIFINFKTYQSYFQHEDAGFKSFGIAQIGKSYRKEISPQPFTRLREFTQAEIEYFCDPSNKAHSDFDSHKNIVIPILTDKMQEEGVDKVFKISVAEAVSQKIISHQLMAYFLAKIYMFAKKIGLNDDKIRFRQHQKNEMAHYASQCWDLECYVSGSWLECVGCADRGCYDLTAHSGSNTKQLLNAKRKLSEPKIITNITIKPDLSKMDGKFLNKIKMYFKNLNQETAQIIADKIKNNNMFVWIIDQIEWTFESSAFTIDEKIITITHETFVPHVIEPSFGIDRLMYAILEQNIWQREIDERRSVLSLPNELTIYDVAVFPLHKKEEMCKIADQIRSKLMEPGFKCYTDDSGTAIGKKYVRCDEIGVRNVITVDPGTLNNGIVTIRDRDSMVQITCHMDNIITWFKELKK
jgi:glycyl-tRNA synthetase